MKIESGSNSLNAIQSGVQRTTATSSKDGIGAVSQVGATSALDSTVSLSTTAASQASRGADIDVAKVEAIKAALRNGTYTMDSGKIADGMLGTARDLLAAQTR